MSKSVMVTPRGRLRLEDAPEAAPAIGGPVAAALQDAFGASNAEGLLLLASDQLAGELPAALVFWRGFARQFFQTLCQLEEVSLAAWRGVAPPPEAELARIAASAPPMRGLEYLAPRLLADLWIELRDEVAARAAKFAGGPGAYLSAVNPGFHRLGRVTFHLAENKRDPSRPFAFLATYSHRISGQSKLHHLPLAEAVKTYAGAKEQARLESLLEPVRRAAEASSVVRELLDDRSLFAPQAWTISQAHRFLTEAPRMEEAGVVVRLPDWWSPRHPPRPQVQVRIGERAASQLGLDQLLDFRVDLAIDGDPLTAAERRQLLRSTDGLVLLRGKWVEVDRERLQQALDHWQQVEQEHTDGVSFIEGMRLLAGARLDTADAADDRMADWSRVTTGDWLRHTLERMRRPDSIDACRPGRDLRATLRPYQAEGVRWLWFLCQLGLGACLADDMGLGKTIQVIDLLLLRRRQSAASGSAPSLIVVPASLLGNWRAEVARFAPTLRVLFAHRSECDAAQLARLADDPRGELADYDAVVTTYGLTRRLPWLAQVDWSLIVLDEAQAIKNAASEQARGVKRLRAVARVVLTGTPVENHVGDLWSIFDFCCPGLLGSASQFKQFVKRLNMRQDAQAFAALRRLVQPYILRRLKTDPAIAPDLPDKTEMRTECGLSKKQAALYERAVDELADKLRRAEGVARRGLVLAALVQFKQICNHPAQYLGGTTFAPRDSGKFDRLRLLCETILERQERMLVFTQFQSLTEPLAKFLAGVFGRPGLVLHGGTPVRRRGELVRSFQDVDGPPFFVISLKAGGSGLNLTAASHVVHFDRWWNPAVENQATDRAFRIGQTRNVLVHKFVCRGTVEERIDSMIRDKQGLADQLLDRDGEVPLTELSDDELLRFVALDIQRATAEAC